MKRANLSKAIYDMAKVTFAGLAIGPLVSGHTVAYEVITGIAATLTLLACAWLLDKQEETE